MRIARCSAGRGQQGWAIISALIAIVIGLIALGGVFLVVLHARGASQIDAEQQNVVAIRQNVIALYIFSPGYAGLNTANAAHGGVFPKGMVKPSGVRNAWGGSVDVEPVMGGERFAIIYRDVPREACAKLALTLYRGWSDVSINNVSIPQVSGAVSLISEACSQGGTNLIRYTAN